MLSQHQLLLEKSRQTDAATRALFKEAKQLLRTVLDHQLGSRILHSRSLMMNAQSSNPAPVKSPQVVISD
jgi:hypothetical protein